MPIFFIVDIEDKEIMETKGVMNNAQYGGGGCQAVDEILRHIENFKSRELIKADSLGPGKLFKINP